MRVIALVNGGFSIPTLRALRDSNHELVAIIAMPDRTKNKGAKAGTPPIRLAVRDFLSDIPLYDPENINSDEGTTLLRSLDGDIIFICDYGRILSQEAISTTRYGGLNLHGSLLPKYRGAAPINRAIQAGERVLGVSVILIEPKVDAGPVVATDSYEPTLSDTAVEIEAHLAEMGAPLVVRTLDQLESGSVASLPQNGEEATKAPKIKKEEGRIDWSKSSAEIVDQYRAFQPWPRVFSDWRRGTDVDSEPLRLILGPFSTVTEENGKFALNSEGKERKPGEIAVATKTEVWIRTGDGAVRLLAAQPSGRKSMPIDAFLRGYPMKVGDVLQ